MKFLRVVSAVDRLKGGTFGFLVVVRCGCIPRRQTWMDGALIMGILKHLPGDPFLFVDVCHYDEKEDFFELCNSGSQVTCYIAKSRDPEGFSFQRVRLP